MVMVLWISSIFGFMVKLVIIPTAHVHRLVERAVCPVGSSVGGSDMLVGRSVTFGLWTFASVSNLEKMVCCPQ